MIEVTSWDSQGLKRVKLYRDTDNKPGGNYAWSFHSPFGPLVHPLAQDLVDIACAIHLADRMVRRVMHLGKRRRQIKVRIPVRKPKVWNKQKYAVEQLAAFSSADDWQLDFVRQSDRETSHRKRTPISAAGVTLFSGGLDSLCGAASLGKNIHDWVFVTHSPPGREPTEKLIHKIAEKFGANKKQPCCVSCRLDIRERGVGGKRSMFHEPTRRTRPFFFLSLACAVAIDLGLRRVQMSENGALGLNLPFRHDAYDGVIARQAHLHMLAGFQELLDDLAPREDGWDIFNPLAAWTKGECCEKLKQASELCVLTHSCEYLGRQAARVKSWKKQHPQLGKDQLIGEGRQCGICLPCIVRRAALHKAGIDDPDEGYFFDAGWARPGASSPLRPKTQQRPPLYDFASTHVFYLEQFCRRLQNTSLKEFAIEFLPELRLAENPSGNIVTTPRERFKLMQRFAHEIIVFLDSRT